MCPADYPGARGPVDHGGHADQLFLDPRLHQQLLGLDWTVQGDVTGKTESLSHSLWFIHPEGSQELGTD